MFSTLFYDGIIALVVGFVPTYFAVTVARKRRGKGDGPGALGALLVLVWAVVVYGSFVEPRLLQVERTDIPLAADGTHNLTIALISDTHLGVYRNADWLATVVARTNALHPDLVFVAGDIASNLAGTGEFKPFKDLQSKYGVYAVLGNWDYRAGAVDVRKALGSQGIKLLVNRSVPINVGDKTVSIIGLDDVTYGKPDLDLAMSEVPPDALKLLLVHNPDAADLAENHGIDLVLAGHTHAGQIRLPYIGAVPHMPIKIGQQFDEGLFPYGMTRLFITPGVGESGARARLFNPPTISFLRVTF